MFSKVLIANRGEIAVRIARTCREMGVATVAIHSDVDARARHVAMADEAVHLPGRAPADTYLNLPAVLEAAKATGAEAIHPGYGFFSERGDAVEAVTAAGLVWIGPPAEATRAVGDKVRARQLATSAGVSVVPGTLRPVEDAEEVHAFGEEHGYPIAIKAAGGGGGRGLRVAAGPEEVPDALAAATREAQAWFGSPGVYLERYLERPKHVEVQILAPAVGEAMWLGARDCSLQRRHQKLVEETPPPLHGALVPSMGEAAVAVADACGYVNAGTVEFLVDEDGRFYFLEVNARLQVEHTITEEVLGLDLVACQLRIAAGEPVGFAQGDLSPRGHAIECRINAENPARGFLPGPGRIDRYREPGGPGVRVDSGYTEGDEVPREYDSLLAKLVVWAPTREEARRRMLRALGEFEIEGIPSTIPAHLVLLEHAEFVDGTYTTRTVEGGALEGLAAQARATAPRATPEPTKPAAQPAMTDPGVLPEPAETESTTSDAATSETSVLLVAGQPVRLWNPTMAAEATASTKTRTATGDGVVRSPMHGTILKLRVGVGDRVEAGELVAVLEAMKMETQVVAPTAGTVTALHAEPGSVVEAGEPLAELG